MGNNQPSHRVFFIFGNQSFEIDCEVQNVVNSFLSKEEQTHSLFTFRVRDFFDSDKNRSAKIIGNFRSTCETVSFFPSDKVIVLHDIQAIPSKKTPVDSLKKTLKEIHLVKTSPDLDAEWFDADSLAEQLETHHHITGMHIVREIECYANKTYFLDLVPEYRNRLVYRKKGTGRQAVEIAEFLRSKIKRNLLFERPANETPIRFGDNARGIALIKGCIESSPHRVVFIVTANIRNIREVNSELANVLQKKAKIIKKTVSYDDFRPISWIITQARSKGVIIDAPTADLLIEIAGTNFSVLNMELEKLSILFPAGSEITPKLLMENISYSRRFTIFRAAEFLLRKDLRNTLECIEQIIGESTSDAIALYALIVSGFRRILRMAWLMEAGYTDKSIIDRLKLNPWAAKQSIKHIRNFTTQELENIVVHLAKLDLQVKYAAKDVLILLENICFQVCQGTLVSQNHLDRSWCP